MKIDTLKYIIVPEKEARDWYESYLRYRALENGGVDNWNWYGKSFNDFIKECWNNGHPNEERKIYEAKYGDYWFDTVVDEDLASFDRLEF